MKFAVILGVLGLSVCHVPNILGSFGAGGMKGFFQRNDDIAALKDKPVLDAY